MNRVASIVDDLIESLNNNLFNPSFVATKNFIPTWKLRTPELKISVLPNYKTIETEARSWNLETIEVLIAVQQKVNPKINTEIDSLINLAEQIILFVDGINLAGAVHYSTSNDPIYDILALEQYHTFVSVITLEFKTSVEVV